MSLPSEQLHALLEGKTTWDEAAPEIRSWVRFFLYKAAVGILKMPKEKRRSAIDKSPETVRPHLEAEIMRVHRYWQTEKSS